MKKEWFSASDLCGLPGLPGSIQGVNKKALKEGWAARPRQQKGGGREFHFSSLPDEAQSFLQAGLLVEQIQESDLGNFGSANEVQISVPALEPVQAVNEVSPSFAPITTTAPVNFANTAKKPKGNIAKSQAVFAVQQAFDRFLDECCNPAGIKKVDCEYRFCEQFNRREIVFPAELDVYRHVRKVSRSTLCAQRQKLQSGESTLDLGGKYGHRKGETVISPEQQSVILGLVTKPVAQIHKQLEARYGEECPSYATITRWVNGWKDKHLQEWTMLKKGKTAFNNQFRAAHGDADAGITRVNQRWEIDATKGDIFLVIGNKLHQVQHKRYSLLRVIDVYSRRIMTLVAPTVSSKDYLQGLLYKAFLEWGIPEEIRTDRGMAETSGLMAMAFADLDIHHHQCNVRSPWEKPFIERSFGTRSLLENLPGFSGSNVFEQREIKETGGHDDVSLRLTPEELQAAIDRWTLAYENRVHRGFEGTNRQGLTPLQAWVGSPGLIRKISTDKDKQALSLLLSDVPHGGGIRTIQKKGIQIGKFWFADNDGEWVAWVGHQVLCKYSPCGDAGIVHCFELGSNGGLGGFLFTATCAELMGENRAEKAVKAHTKQKAVGRAVTELKKLAKAVAAESVEVDQETGEIIAFPLPSEQLETVALAAATEALEAVVPKMPKPLSDQELEAQRIETERLERLERKAKISVLEDPGDKYRRLWFERKGGGVLCDADIEFIERFESFSEGRMMKKILEADAVEAV